MRSPQPRRPDWLPDALVLALVALIGTVPFWLTDLDLRLASLFWHPELDNPWIEAEGPLWSFLYLAAPLAMGLVCTGRSTGVGGRQALDGDASPATLCGAGNRHGPDWPRTSDQRAGQGPVGSPQAHQVETLGGTREYLPPLKPGEPGKGKSFPSGHSSVGFMLGGSSSIWRRRRPWLAWTALAGAIGFGLRWGSGAWPPGITSCRTSSGPLLRLWRRAPALLRDPAYPPKGGGLGTGPA